MGLGRVDRMAAGDGDAGLGADRSAALQDFAGHLDRQFVERHAEDGERHDRRAAHGIDIGDRIGRGDAAEIMGVVDHRHEEIGGRDHAGLVVDLPDGGVVAGLGADEQLLVGTGGRVVGQQLLQHGGCELAAAAAAMRQAGQARRGSARRGVELDRVAHLSGLHIRRRSGALRRASARRRQAPWSLCRCPRPCCPSRAKA